MMDIREPAFRWGDRVVATVDLLNDGSHPGVTDEALLAPSGTVGEVVNVGHHAETNMPVYVVEFTSPEGRPVVVGCLEDELVRA